MNHAVETDFSEVYFLALQYNTIVYNLSFYFENSPHKLMKTFVRYACAHAVQLTLYPILFKADL